MVDLRVYDVTGALVKVVEKRHRDRGRYEVGWNGENSRGEQVTSGVYFYKITAEGFSQTRKMVLLK
jgi:flagellar hook assembly protein FlgD